MNVSSILSRNISLGFLATLRACGYGPRVASAGDPRSTCEAPEESTGLTTVGAGRSLKVAAAGELTSSAHPSSLSALVVILGQAALRGTADMRPRGAKLLAKLQHLNDIIARWLSPLDAGCVSQTVR